MVLLIYLIMTMTDREYLGQLETFDYDPGLTYCNYIIEDGTTDAGYLNKGDSICIVCNDKYPDVKDVCHSRIEFVSASGLVTYRAKINGTISKICYACTTAKQCYRVPDQ